MICTHCEQTIDKPYHTDGDHDWCSARCVKEWMAQNMRDLREQRRAEDYANIRALEQANIKLYFNPNRGYHWKHQQNSSCYFDTRRQALHSATAYLAYKNGGEQ